MRTLYRLIIISILLFCISTILVSQAKKRPARILKNENMGRIEKLDVLNTKYSETNISITPDGKYLYFETDRPSDWSTKNYSGSRYDADIWFSKLVDGRWQDPKNVGRTINTPQSEGEPNISPDGQIMYFQSWRSDWKETGGPYYKVELMGEKWVNPVGLGSGINEFFSEMETKRVVAKSMGTDGVTFSADGKTFIFSFGLDYYGNMDIYITRKNDKGEWSKPAVLPFSTEYNDRCPFLAADGKTLYFASNGYEGYGKMDIYKTTLNNDGTMGEVVNIGEPFNTKEDDYGFLITGSGNDIYFVRGGDIYHMDIKDAVTEIRPTLTVILSGKVTDSITGDPLEALVSVIDQNTKREAGSSRSNSKTGEYSIVLKGGTGYQQIVKKENYKTFVRDFQTSNEYTENTLVLDIALASVKEASVIEEPVVEKEPVVKIIEPEAPPCISKLIEQKYALGIMPTYPLAVGIKLETYLNNFCGSIVGMFLPSVGEYDDPKPPDDLMSDNYSTIILASVSYNFPLFNCKLYPNAGFFAGARTRYWKKPLQYGTTEIIKEGNYTDYPWGFTIGLKYFITDNFYLDASLALGSFAFHELLTGDIKKYEFKSIPWIAICYMFD